MDVQVDGELIRSEREKRAWSQEHLAGAAGIGVRTIQRIEATSVASYESATCDFRRARDPCEVRCAATRVRRLRVFVPQGAGSARRWRSR